MIYLRYEIRFENCVKDKNNAIWQKRRFFFKIPKNLIASDFFIFLFAEADTKTYRYASTKAWNVTPVKLNYWIIKNDHAINCGLFFCKW